MDSFKRILSIFVKYHPLTVVSLTFFSLFSIVYLITVPNIYILRDKISQWDMVNNNPNDWIDENNVIVYFYMVIIFGFVVGCGNVIILRFYKKPMMICWIVMNMCAMVLILLTVVSIIRTIGVVKKVQVLCKDTELQMEMFDPGSEAMKVLTDICQTKVIWIPTAVSSGLCSVLQLMLAADLIVALFKFNTREDIRQKYDSITGTSLILDEDASPYKPTLIINTGEDDNSL